MDKLVELLVEMPEYVGPVGFKAALVEYVKACDDLAAEYAHYLNERDGVQRELDPYDAARAALLSALGGER